MNNSHNHFGLHPLPHDVRDFSHDAVFGTAPVDELPTIDFDVAPVFGIKNQYDLDFCAGFSISEVNEDLQQRQFDPLYQYSKICQVRGDYTSYGANLRDACKSVVKFGSLPIENAPFTHNPSDPTSKERNFLANWQNWSQVLDSIAAEYRAGTYFAIDGSHDDFDNIRSTLWMNQAERRSVEIGVMWRPEWTYAPGGVIPEANYASPGGNGHAIKIIGQKMINGVPYLKIVNSWGNGMGDNGFYYFPRSVINKEVATFGAFTLKDMAPEDAQWFMKYGVVVSDAWYVVLIKMILLIGKGFLSTAKSIMN